MFQLYNEVLPEIEAYHVNGLHSRHCEGKMTASFNFRINPILPGLLNTLQTRGGYFTPPPNSLVFYPRSIKFGMWSLTGNIF